MRFLPQKSFMIGLLTAGALAALAVPGSAQQGSFDFDRAFFLDENPYIPFLVEEMQPLSEALAEGRVQRSTPILIADLPTGRIAVSTDQLSFHIVAQGESRGEPWMVAF